MVLEPLATPERAVGMSAYLKHRFPFLGIPTPARRAATHALIRDSDERLIPAAQSLWQLPQREYQHVACDLLRKHVGRLGPQDLATLESLVTTKSWWDTVDGLAVTIGDLVRRHPALAARMDELIVADDFWLRRVALLHQLAWKAETDEARLFDYCLRCTGEKEFFIRKAIGWALRQHARTRPDAVRAFLSANLSALSPLSVREAAKHLGAIGQDRISPRS